MLIIIKVNKTCIVCNFYKCTQCTNGPVCISCQSGYYLDATYKLCMPCSYPCVECNGTATNCTICPTNQLFYFDNLINNCSWCNKKFNFCSSCDYYGNECHTCNTTRYYVDSATKTCLACSGTCY